MKFNIEKSSNFDKDKEYFGQEFKKILENSAHYYDSELSEMMRGVAGEEFAKANRSSTILKNALLDFTKTEGFPEKVKNDILTKLALIDSTDPMMERLNYYNANNEIDKNQHALNHDNKLGHYKSQIKDLLDSLQNILPENMYQELLLRNDMFADVMKWVDKNKSNI